MAQSVGLENVSQTSLTRTKAVEEGATQAPRRRWLRYGLLLLGAAVGAIAALWVVVHRYDWAGPLVANTLRKLVGTDNVARLEDFVYSIEDQVQRLKRSSEGPKAYWSVPSAPNPSVEKAGSGSQAQLGAGGTAAMLGTVGARLGEEASKAPARAPFRPKDVGPVNQAWSAEGDGEWVAIGPSDEHGPYLYKTLLHPDQSRSWSEVFVVAMDLSRIDVHLLPGSKEPQANNKAAEGFARPAKVPADLHSTVLAAFNGGFMTEHGGWGMLLDGVAIVTPKPNGCTLFAYRDGSFAIGTFSKHESRLEDVLWYRQGPECMAEDGKLHPGLSLTRARKWGATLDGETVIRRSAVGLDQGGKILYFAITNHTNAPVLAKAMLHVGAPTVLQMDVNWSYPKFVLFERKSREAPPSAVALAPGFEFSPDEYLRRRSIRDFFYVVPKAAKND